MIEQDGKEQKVLEEVKEKLQREAARKTSIKEGCFSTIQGSFGDTYIPPFAVAINSSNSQIAMLTSLTNLFGPLSQFLGSRLMNRYSRKKIVLVSLLLQVLMWIPIIGVAILFWKSIWTGALPILLIIFFASYAIFGNLAGPAWFSWMGDIVDETDRGGYFSKRNRIAGLVAVIAMIVSAFFLDIFKKHGFLLLGFCLFFFIAMIGRTIARELFKKQYEPKLALDGKYYFSFWDFVKKAPFNNFGRFTIYRSLLGLVVSIAGPFFAVYMLRNLGFSYINFIIVSTSATIFSLFAMPLWGKFSDKFGNYEVMRITSLFIFALPILWLVSPSPYYLALVPEMLSGFAWAGFNLAAGNYIYDCVTIQRRGLVVSYYNIMNGIGVFLGATIGALMVAYIHVNFMAIIPFIFLVSGILRLAVSLFMLPKIKEVRCVKPFEGNRVFKNLIFDSVRSIYGSHQFMITEFIKKKKSEFFG